ncbi:MAG: peptide chain release factor N(5)-glutamine methyltransferase [Candidatus Thiodiazotropha sp. 6PLUC9]
MTTLREALLSAQKSLKNGPDSQPELEASLLLCHLLGKPKSYLYAWPEAGLSPSQEQSYQQLVEQRLSGRPIAYILEQREFWSLSLRVTPNTLIPRAETELAVERSLFHLQHIDKPTLADLGTGSGAIALALSSERPEGSIDATDASPEALAVAEENAHRLGFKNIDFHLGDWCKALPIGTKYDILVSNPPYIESGDPHLTQGDLPQEPISALASGEDGLNDIRLIIAQAPAYLKKNGWLILEHGYCQAVQVTTLLQSAGMVEITTHTDLAGNPRVTEARLP